MQLRGTRVMVVGLARTGVATALFCAAQGALVSASDLRSEQQLGDCVEKLRATGVRLHFGEPTPSILQGQELVVPSPGVPADTPLLEQAREMGIPVWSEIELAGRFLRGKLIGITGSNGKTTTTSLIEHILRNAGIATLLAGNIGTPLIAQVGKTTDDTVSVAELSSFQLELIASFRPHIAVFLNLTPDHLDRHKTLDAYGAAKACIFANQTRDDFAVLNADDTASAAYAPASPRVLWFSRRKMVTPGAFVRDDQIVFAHHGEEEKIIALSQLPLPGAHNLENVLAAAVATRLAGVRPAQIEAGIKSFAGVEHRIEFVAEIQGVRYYNDSKATNVDATLKALESFPGHILVILGGKDKDSDYTQLRATLREKAILALLIGAAADKIERQIAGSVAIERAGTMENAVEAAFQSAHSGDIVLLSPACASFDQFQNYEHRGRVFKDLVHQLAQRTAVARGAEISNRSNGERRNA
ncbi:MAG TPA: UDP-N-acetylmuramoyl-L-alanine--D-glutamate ligase [Candidatus Acidoferrum sp.]|nr:UDP-N-acetylmuramoyl-L-alanine--D-glutamate ligase [Candidatus Acidoferrum sp.]